MIKLTQLYLQNFFSHVGTHLPLKDYGGLVLIEGQNADGHYSSNGSGKSTLLEGIVYALTGDTLRGVGVNDVVNRNHKKNTKVSLGFQKGDNSYVVSRYRKDDEYGDSLLLSENHKYITKRVNKETQKSLEDILGISYKVLSSTMLLGEGLSSRFTQLSDPEKKSLIESTLNLNYDISSIRVKANSKLSQLRLDKSNLEGRISAMKEISSLDVEETRKQVAINEAEASKAAAELASLETSLAGRKDEFESLTKKMDVLKESLNQYDSLSKELSRLSAEKEGYVNELKFSESSETPICTVCHQHLVSEDSLKAFRDSYKSKIDVTDMQIAEVSRKIGSLPDRSLVETTYLTLQGKMSELTASIHESTNKMNSLANQRWSSQSQADQLKATITRYEESESDIVSLTKENDLLDREIIKYDYFYKLFSPTGIIVSILAEAIEYINGRLSTYSSVLLEKDYRINFVKGKISLVDNTGASYQSLSNGEKRRLDISIQFALHDYVMMYCGMKMDCCFIDEILDTLDDIGVENIFDVLRLKLDYCKLKSIYVITHNDALKNKFDQVITVKKDASGDSFLD